MRKGGLHRVLRKYISSLSSPESTSVSCNESGTGPPQMSEVPYVFYVSTGPRIMRFGSDGVEQTEGTTNTTTESGGNFL